MHEQGLEEDAVEARVDLPKHPATQNGMRKRCLLVCAMIGEFGNSRVPFLKYLAVVGRAGDEHAGIDDSGTQGGESGTCIVAGLIFLPLPGAALVLKMAIPKPIEQDNPQVFVNVRT